MRARFATAAVVAGVVLGLGSVAPAGVAADPLTPPLPVPAGLPVASCDDPYQHVCFDQDRDASNRPVHTVCVRDDAVGLVRPSWEPSELGCVKTEHFAYLPGPGACVVERDRERPLVCVNGWDCTVYAVGAWVLCHEVPS